MDQAVLLRLEGGDEDGCGKVVGEVAGGDADVPFPGAPFGEFVVGEGAGGDGVDGLAAIAAEVGPEFEDQGFAGAGGRVDDDVLAGAEGGDGLLLPEVGDHDALERGEAPGAFRGAEIELAGHRLHARNFGPTRGKPSANRTWPPGRPGGTYARMPRITSPSTSVSR